MKSKSKPKPKLRPKAKINGSVALVVNGVAHSETSSVEPAESRPDYTLPEAHKAYGNRAAQFSLLTRAEEKELGRRIQRGMKNRRYAKDGDVAREIMIKANLRLVIKIAGDFDFGVLPLLDLINEGNIGLMKAVEKFDPKRGNKFSTYAAWWIKQSIKRALANQGKTIRLPVHVKEKALKMRRVAMALSGMLGREATDEEIADEMCMTALAVRRLMQASMATTSLDTLIGGNGSSDGDPLSDVVADESAIHPGDECVAQANYALLRRLLGTLPKREQVVLVSRFGLDGDKERTLEIVGQKFGITRERVRQIQNIAIRKLRRLHEKAERV
ncbi:MAG: RNA polymerase sigma factor RpoD/SigA [Patescibacteria group bacterium]